jgi:hypothetical protein
LDQKKEDSKQACRKSDDIDVYFAEIKNGRKCGITLHRNAFCIKCGALEKIMMQVGSVPFCKECCAELFKTDNPPVDEKDEYQKWLVRFHSQMMQEQDFDGQ